MPKAWYVHVSISLHSYPFIHQNTSIIHLSFLNKIFLYFSLPHSSTPTPIHPILPPVYHLFPEPNPFILQDTCILLSFYTPPYFHSSTHAPIHPILLPVYHLFPEPTPFIHPFIQPSIFLHKIKLESISLIIIIVSTFRETRVREHLAARYDVRANVYDWDIVMKLQKMVSTIEVLLPKCPT